MVDLSFYSSHSFYYVFLLRSIFDALLCLIIVGNYIFFAIWNNSLTLPAVYSGSLFATKYLVEYGIFTFSLLFRYYSPYWTKSCLLFMYPRMVHYTYTGKDVRKTITFSPFSIYFRNIWTLPTDSLLIYI